MSLDDKNKRGVDDKFPDISEFSLPNLEEIEEFEDDKENFEDDKENPEISNESNEHEEKYNTEDFENEDKDSLADLEEPDFNSESFEVVHQSEVGDPEYDRANDEQVLNYEEEDPYGYDLGDEEEFGSLLPGVELEDESKEDSYEVEDESYEEDESKSAPKRQEKGFKEIDEDKIKDFFAGIITKFKPSNKKKGNKAKQREPNKNKLKNDEVDRKSKRAKNFIKKPDIDINKLKNMDKTKLIYLGSGVALIILLTIGYFMWSSSYDNLENLEKNVEIKDKDYPEYSTQMTLTNLSLNDEGFNVDIENNSDTSKNFSLYIELKSKSFLPLMGTKYQCESDILYLEPGDKINESLYCSEMMNNDSKYKVTNIEIDEF